MDLSQFLLFSCGIEDVKRSRSGPSPPAATFRQPCGVVVATLATGFTRSLKPAVNVHLRKRGENALPYLKRPILVSK